MESARRRGVRCRWDESHGEECRCRMTYSSYNVAQNDLFAPALYTSSWTSEILSNRCERRDVTDEMRPMRYERVWRRYDQSDGGPSLVLGPPTAYNMLCQDYSMEMNHVAVPSASLDTGGPKNSRHDS